MTQSDHTTEEEEVAMDLTSLTSLRQKESSSKRGQGFVVTLLKPRTTNLLSAIIAAFVLAVCGILLFSGYKSLRDAQSATIIRETESTRVAAIQRSYDADLRLYDKKAQDYQGCLSFAETRVDGRVALRDTLFHLVDGFVLTLKTVAPDSKVAIDFADLFTADQHAYIDTNYAPLNLDELQGKCVKPGNPPAKPPELS